jgi:pre-60S factor REI1
MNSKNHNKKTKKQAKDRLIQENKRKESTEEEEEEEEKKIIILKSKPDTTLDNIKICLFCNKEHGDLEQNLEHMKEEHSFFVPSQKYIKDIRSIIGYLAEKIHIGHICICTLFKDLSLTPTNRLQ